ncbi:MAG: GTP pyrophosphokinase family protein [Anaerovoracaceae bacterium]|nr:GTP pyrophosphokinase family protein [Bacillota bacterium]MDY2669978.1 GTP pyrophosphokinase family protein [Anaerovoracaceae bacterium]
MDNTQKELINLTNLPLANLPEDTGAVFGAAESIKSMLMKYSCAIREVKTKLEVLSDEFSAQNQRNPIEFITSRVKTPKSIMQKLHRRGLPVTMESAQENLFDIAGVRVICSFVDDIYSVAGMLIDQDDVELVKTKDYIKNPKPNGYRSLHLIIRIPVFFSDGKRKMPVEVQIRTIAMDFWASLEHDLKYKKVVPNVEDVQRELKDCADTIADTDMRMMKLRDEIDRMKVEEEMKFTSDGSAGKHEDLAEGREGGGKEQYVVEI